VIDGRWRCAWLEDGAPRGADPPGGEERCPRAVGGGLAAGAIGSPHLLMLSASAGEHLRTRHRGAANPASAQPADNFITRLTFR